MMNISTHISYDEAVFSSYARNNNIDNKPNSLQLANMVSIANNIFEPLRELYGNNPIIITSFFREPFLNKKIGGASNSQHTAMNGAAMDLKAPNGKHEDLFKIILENLNFDQLIWEFGDNNTPDWVHVSYVSKKVNRNQVLKSYKENGTTKYSAIN